MALKGNGKKTSNIATYGKLGRYPLYIDIVLVMIKYWLRISKDPETDTLMKEALKDNYDIFRKKKDCWLNCIYTILKGCNL